MKRHSSISEHAVSILRKVKKHILEEPKRLDMENWLIVGDNVRIIYGRNAPACGTVGCIAGWVNVLGNSNYDYNYFSSYRIAENAAEILKISYYPNYINEKYIITQGNLAQLFVLHSWPSKYLNAYKKAKSPAGRARVTANRIEYFIWTGL